MNRRNRLVGALIIGAAAIWVIVTTVTMPDRSDVLEKSVMLAFREIGHQLLLKSGDPHSRVLPVRRINPTVFHLEFQSAFRFVPDTLVRVVHASLQAGKLPTHYMVNVMECATNQVIYGYRIGDQQQTVVPCRGREQPMGCYFIEIAFAEDPVPQANHPWWIGAVLTTLAAFALVLYGKDVLGQKEIDRLSGEPFVQVGTYVFYETRRTLKHGTTTVALTEKEARLLSILVANKNQPMDRDRLLKEVWEDDHGLVGRRLDVFISRLRKKLTGDPTVRIVSIHGKGYKLESDAH